MVPLNPPGIIMLLGGKGFSNAQPMMPRGDSLSAGCALGRIFTHGADGCPCNEQLFETKAGKNRLFKRLDASFESCSIEPKSDCILHFTNQSENAKHSLIFWFDSKRFRIDFFVDASNEPNCALVIDFRLLLSETKFRL